MAYNFTSSYTSGQLVLLVSDNSVLRLLESHPTLAGSLFYLCLTIQSYFLWKAVLQFVTV